MHWRVKSGMACQVCQIGSKGELCNNGWTGPTASTNIYYKTLPTNELVLTAKMAYASIPQQVMLRSAAFATNVGIAAVN